MSKNFLIFLVSEKILHFDRRSHWDLLLLPTVIMVQLAEVTTSKAELSKFKTQ